MRPIRAFAMGILVAGLVATGNVAASAESAGPSSSSSQAPDSHVLVPFTAPGSGVCMVPPQAGCVEDDRDDAIRVTMTVPSTWTTSEDGPSLDWGSPSGAALIVVRGASLFDDPCVNAASPEILVGPTVDDFAEALDNHPLLDVTTPVDVTLAGYAGKYVDLHVPVDPTIQGSSQPASNEGCPVYRPWKPWYLAQSSGERWHLWILDVDGVRVVVQAMDHGGTPPAVQSELLSIVGSIAISAGSGPSPSASGM